jgi:hypothetical protein
VLKLLAVGAQGVLPVPYARAKTAPPTVCADTCVRMSVAVLQIGKSGASWITQAFLLGCGSIAAAMPFTGVIFAAVIVTWIQVRWGAGCVGMLAGRDQAC